MKEEYEKKRIIIYKEEKEKKKKELIELKNQKNLMKIQQPIKKKTGRNDMKRSSPFEKVVEEVEEYIETIIVEEEVIEIPEEIVIIIEEEDIDDKVQQELLDNKEEKEELAQEPNEKSTLEDEEVIEVIKEIIDLGVESIELDSEEILEVVDTYIEESIEQADTLTEEQTKQVAEVLGLEDTNDVQIIAEAVKEDEAVAQAVDEFVARAVENKDVENYTLADVVVEVQVEEFLADPLGSFTDIQIDEIDLAAIGNDMTDDQKEKAQEVVVPVIIASQIVASVQVVPVRIRRRV